MQFYPLSNPMFSSIPLPIKTATEAAKLYYGEQQYNIELLTFK